MNAKIHRWQPTGFTLCGRPIAQVATNVGRYLSDGVTCAVCQRGQMRWSILWDDWNGQSDGAPDRRTPAELAEAERLRVEREAWAARERAVRVARERMRGC